MFIQVIGLISGLDVSGQFEIKFCVHDNFLHNCESFFKSCQVEFDYKALLTPLDIIISYNLVRHEPHKYILFS